jgi:hypothetical protein
MAAIISKEQVFKRHQKVVAAVDLPHVPTGTPGTVLYVAGVTWIRYHVGFENGETISSLDATQLMSRQDWEEQQYEAQVAERKAARAAARAGAGTATGTSGTGTSGTGTSGTGTSGAATSTTGGPS